MDHRGRNQNAKLYIGNLDNGVSEQELREAFEKYGTLSDVFLPKDPQTGEKRGFAFVTYDDEKDALDAIAQMDGKDMAGRTLHLIAMVAVALFLACNLQTAAYVLGVTPANGAGAAAANVRQSAPRMAEAVTGEKPTQSISWDSHTYVSEAPDTLVRDDDLSGANMDMRRRFEANCRRAQNAICQAVQELDGATFKEDVWTREGGGGGISRVMANGNVFEKAGCSLSVVYGSMPQEALASATTRGADRAKGYAPGERVPFFACGLSSVMHPRNPMAPTMHFNYRYFETEGGVWWFGGGTDLTPSYLFEEDVKHFHGSYKEVCDKHDPTYYERFKKWADEYFYIKHRGETRGLGGIFFDDQNDKAPETIFEFSKECLDNVVPAYLPLVAKHKDDEFTKEQKEWQQMRRGRYVEFNLVYDRGTVFGLKTGGRIESILMSLPETARWEYNHKVVEGSPEADILDAFKNPREWC